MNLIDHMDSIMGVRTHSIGTRVARHQHIVKDKEKGLVQISIHIPDLRINMRTTRTTSKIPMEKILGMHPCGNHVSNRSKHYQARARVPLHALGQGRVVNQKVTVDLGVDQEVRARTHTVVTRVVRAGLDHEVGTERVIVKAETQKPHRVPWEGQQNFQGCVCEIYQQDPAVSWQV